MRRRLLFDFACSLRLIDGQAPLAFAPARLSVRRSPLRGAGAWEYLSITERHVAGSYERHHVSIEGRRRNRWGIALRFTGRWTLFLSWSGIMFILRCANPSKSTRSTTRFAEFAALLLHAGDSSLGGRPAT